MPVPIDFPARRLPIEYAPVQGQTLMRILRKPPAGTLDPIRFSASMRNRFDSPSGSFGVIYAAFDLSTCFAESITRDANSQPLQHGGIIVSDAADIQTRLVAVLTCQRPLRLANMTDSGLYGVGAEAGEFNSVSYQSTTQVWSEQIFGRAESVDGILYRSRFLNGRTAVAIFDRGGSNVMLGATSVVPLDQHPQYSTALNELNICLMP